jgi:hypothetical protein
MGSNGGRGPLGFLDDRVADPVCPVCSVNDYEVPKDISRIHLPAADLEGRLLPGNTLAAQPLICRNCGFIRLHALAIIEDTGKD